MRRSILLSCVLLIGAAAAFLLINKQANNISLFAASAVQSSENDNQFMVSLRIENTGSPDRLIGAFSPSAKHVSIMNPNGNGADIVIPKNGTGLLAMDGAHFMVMTPLDSFGKGAFLPLTLTFENAGDVSIRVQNTGPTMMSHGQGNGISEDPAPELSLEWETAPTVDGAVVKLTTQNFTFTRKEDGAAHVPNQGHAHVYLNGLKLGRLYDDTYKIGALSPGKYQLSVALNSNDHRPYLNNNLAVRSALKFEIFE